MSDTEKTINNSLWRQTPSHFLNTVVEIILINVWVFCVDLNLIIILHKYSSWVNTLFMLIFFSWPLLTSNKPKLNQF